MTLESAAELAAFSIGRLDAALNGHPLRPAWEHRTRLVATVAASNWDGRGVDSRRLAGLMAGAFYPQPTDGSAGSGMADYQALAFLSFLAGLTGGTPPPPTPTKLANTDKGKAAEKAERRDLGILRGDLRLFERALEQSKAPSTLLAIADVAWSMRIERDILPGILHAAIPVTLHKRGATGGAIPGLAAYPARMEEKSEWKERFFHDLAAAADAGLSRLRGLSLTHSDWRLRLGERRSNSRLPYVLAAALCHPVLTPAGVARLFKSVSVRSDGKTGMSIPGASKLLAELQRERIVTVGTDRKGSHRLYFADDLAVELHERPKRSGTRARIGHAAAKAEAPLPPAPRAPKRMPRPPTDGPSPAEINMAAVLLEVAPSIDRTNLLLYKNGFASLVPMEDLDLQEFEEEPADEPLAFFEFRDFGLGEFEPLFLMVLEFLPDRGRGLTLSQGHCEESRFLQGRGCGHARHGLGVCPDKQGDDRLGDVFDGG